MTIDRNTTIKQLLQHKEEEVIAALVKLNSNFSKLKNPLLRNLLAKRVSIADACRIAKCNVHEFLRTMQSIGFQLYDEAAKPQHEKVPLFAPPAPEQTEELDVRPILEDGKDPLKLIMHKINELPEGKVLKIINTFEPLPLINLLAKKGFQAHTERQAPDYVLTWFYRTDQQVQPASEKVVTAEAPAENFNELLSRFQGRLQVIDVTMYEMPKPMITILQKIEELEPGKALFVYHKKVPVYLLPHLHDRGFNYLIQQEDEHKVSLLIYKK